jgi:hypothetical protein
VKAVDGADLDTVGEFAFDAGFGDNKRHCAVSLFIGAERVRYSNSRILSRLEKKFHLNNSLYQAAR